MLYPLILLGLGFFLGIALVLIRIQLKRRSKAQPPCPICAKHKELPYSPSKSPLLNLPAELRNNIYRFVLVINEDKKVSGPFTEPGILQTCRQIRAEGTPIYYCTSEWTIDVHSWDLTLFKTFLERVHSRGICLSSLPIKIKAARNLVGDPFNKANLLEFIKYMFSQEAGGGCGHQPERKPFMSAVTGAFEISTRMGKRGRTWDEVLEVLEVYFVEVSKGRRGWDWT